MDQVGTMRGSGEEVGTKRGPGGDQVVTKWGPGGDRTWSPCGPHFDVGVHLGFGSCSLAQDHQQLAHKRPSDEAWALMARQGCRTFEIQCF